jgi:hypothetical protein
VRAWATRLEFGSEVLMATSSSPQAAV